MGHLEHSPATSSDQPGSPWSITSEERGGSLVVSISGELDLHAATHADVDAILTATTASNVSLDLEGVTFMDSVGMGFVLRLKGRARELGATADIASWPQHVGLFGDLP
jgi:anti-anti-sigma factor